MCPSSYKGCLQQLDESTWSPPRLSPIKKSFEYFYLRIYDTLVSLPAKMDVLRDQHSYGAPTIKGFHPRLVHHATMRWVQLGKMKLVRVKLTYKICVAVERSYAMYDICLHLEYELHYVTCWLRLCTKAAYPCKPG